MTTMAQSITESKKLLPPRPTDVLPVGIQEQQGQGLLRPAARKQEPRCQVGCLNSLPVRGTTNHSLLQGLWVRAGTSTHQASRPRHQDPEGRGPSMQQLYRAQSPKWNLSSMETAPQGAMKFPALGDTWAVLAQAQSAELWEVAAQGLGAPHMDSSGRTMEWPK